LCGYINNNNSTIWTTKNSKALHRNSFHSSEIGICCAVYQNLIVDPTSYKADLLQKVFKNLLTQLTALLEENKQDCWFQHDAAATHCAKPQLTCRTSPVITLSGVPCGHNHPQALCHLISFCEKFLKKQSTATKQIAQITLNITLNRLLVAITKKLFEKL